MLYVIPPSGLSISADGKVIGHYVVGNRQPEVYGDYRSETYLGKDGKMTDWANAIVFETYEEAKEAIGRYEL